MAASTLAHALPIFTQSSESVTTRALSCVPYAKVTWKKEAGKGKPLPASVAPRMIWQVRTEKTPLQCFGSQAAQPVLAYDMMQTLSCFQARIAVLVLKNSV